jgi:large subunit ribosomal protein L21
MYAVVEIGGQQYRIEKDMKLKVTHLNSEPGGKISFDRVLLLQDRDGTVTLGKPVIKDKQVTATVIEHGREKKVIVFKKKRRKGYQKKNGHRQDYTLIEINDIKTVKATVEAKKPAADLAKTEEKKTATVSKTKKSTTAAKTEAKTKTAAVKAKPKPGTAKTQAKATVKTKTTAPKTTKKTAPKAKGKAKEQKGK